MLIGIGHLEEEALSEFHEEGLVGLDMLGGFFFGILFGFFRYHFHEVGFHLDRGDKDAGDGDDELFLAFALDTHDGAFTSVVEASADTDPVTGVQLDFVGGVIGDFFTCLFGEGDEILHVMVGDCQIIFFV